MIYDLYYKYKYNKFSVIKLTYTGDNFNINLFVSTNSKQLKFIFFRISDEYT
jgi:hypothetical protein